MKPLVGQIWIDRGVASTVDWVGPNGLALMRLATGERLPVPPSFFSRTTDDCGAVGTRFVWFGFAC